MTTPRQLLLLALVLASVHAVPAAAVQSVPSVLPGDLAIGPAGGVQRFPAIAAGPGVHLVAWADHRSAFETLTTGVGTRDVQAILVDAAGAPVTPHSFRVAGGFGRKQDVRVAWNGTHFLVTWRTEVPTTFSKAAGLHAARVDAQGQVVDQPALVVRNYDWSSTFAYDLASDGTDWIVVVQGAYGGETDVEAWRIAASGSVTQASPALVTTASLLLGFQLEWDGAQWLLTWNSSGVRGRRFDATFAPLGADMTIASAGANEGTLAANPAGGFLAAWSRDFNGYTVEYRTITPGGALGTVVPASSASSDGYQPAVAWNGNGYTLAWTAGLFPPTTLRFARIDSAGALLNPGGLPHGQGADTAFPEIASLGDGNAQLAWIEKHGTPPHVGDVYGTRLTPAVADATVALSTGAPRQGSPGLAAGGLGYLAVFTSERGGAVSILAQRLDAVGNAIDAQPIELGAGVAFGHPRAAWNGSSFLVVWHDEKELSFLTDDVVLARRVGADGMVLDPAPFHVLDGATPDVAAASGTFLVAARHAFTTQLFHLRAARVGGNGVVLDPASFQVGGNYARFPSVGSFGDRWVVAWQRNPTHDNPGASVRARVVMTDGTMTPDVVAGGGSRPAVAASSQIALIVWNDGGGVWARRMDVSGTFVDVDSLLVPTGSSINRPDVAWNGNVFVAAWEDWRNQATYFDDRRDVFAARVAQDGTNLDGSGFAVASSPDDEQLPAVAGAGGSHIFALADFRPDAPYAAVRIAVVRPSTGTTFCAGDGSGAACPCGNTGAAGNGCASSVNAAGGNLAATGQASVSADTITLIGSGMPNSSCLYFQGTGSVANGAGAVFGDGVRCAAGTVIRLGAQTNVGGASSYPAGGDAPVAQKGAVPAGGGTRYYQCWYRNAAPYCTAATFNMTNGVRIDWLP